MNKVRRGLVAGPRKVLGVVGLFCLFGLGCAAAPRGNDEVVRASGQSIRYRFPLPDGTSVGADDLVGRATIILFLTTYDPVSHAIAQRLNEYQHTRVPRINVLAVALEPPQNAPLIAVYRETLAVGFPVALADQDTLEGHGPFGDVRAVPTLVLLDRESKVVRRGVGVAAWAEIEALLNETTTQAR